MWDVQTLFVPKYLVFTGCSTVKSTHSNFPSSCTISNMVRIHRCLIYLKVRKSILWKLRAPHSIPMELRGSYGSCNRELRARTGLDITHSHTTHGLFEAFEDGNTSQSYGALKINRLVNNCGAEPRVKSNMSSSSELCCGLLWIV